MPTPVDVVHIGFIKTGTTSLHTEILPYAKELLVLGKPYLISDEFRDYMQDFINANPYDFEAGEFQARIQALFEQHISKNHAEKPVLISNDLWSGDIFTGLDSREIIDRIRATFGSVRVIVTVREQRSIIESWYKHYVAGGGSLHIRDFMYRRVSPSVGAQRTRYMFTKFKYDRIVAHLQKSFGRGQVKVLFYENLSRDPTAFYKEYFDFIGVENPVRTPELTKRQNVAFGILVLKVLRLFNQVVATPYSDSPIFRPFEHLYFNFTHRVARSINDLFPKGLPKGKRFIDYPKYWWWEKALFGAKLLDPGESLSIKISEEIQATYAPSNRRLQELVDQDLTSLGYALE